MNESAQSRRSVRSVLEHLRFRRFSTVQLLIALVILLVSAPFVEELEGGHFILSLLFSLVLIAAVFAVANRKRRLGIAFVLGLPTIIARWVNQLRPDLVHPAVFLVCALVLLAFVIGHLLYFILSAPVVNVEVLCASIAAYLMLGLTWTVAYWLVGLFNPRRSR